MASAAVRQASHNGVARTERGLVVAGTRVTLYAIMDYVLADWSAEQITNMLPLSRQQVDAALAYIAAHRPQVDAEYGEVLRHAEEERAYWEERNRGLFERIRTQPRSPEKAALLERIRRYREQLGG